MTQLSDLNNHDPSGADFLPDFCAGQSVFAMLLITELVAILLTLAAAEAGPGLWQSLLWLSLYLQWIGVCCAAGLCILRRRLKDQPGRRVAFLAYILLIVITGVIAEISYFISQQFNLPLALEMFHDEFLVRSMAISAVVSALTLRYFWIQRQWRRETLATGQARYDLLQARIRPHFLFNSLNSIAELAATQPRAAEAAVEDLATLFRANLNQGRTSVTLAEELELSRAYLRMETLRLGERLSVDWQISPGLEQIPIPPLILQPLLENAVRHGIEGLPEGGCIVISLSREHHTLKVVLENPFGTTSDRGTGEALKNIRQRIHWLYGDESSLDIESEKGHFRVSLRLPIEDGS